MKRSQLEHVLRAAAAISQETSFVVIGSQALLLTHPEPPAELALSNEVDLYPALRPERADMIEGAIGVLSQFHDTFGYHADGVGPDTAQMPADWMTYATLHYIGDITVVCPELHDLTVSKCVAGRDKDAHWVRDLLRHQLITSKRLLEPIAQLDSTRHPIGHITAWAQRRVDEATFS